MIYADDNNLSTIQWILALLCGIFETTQGKMEAGETGQDSEKSPR